MDYDPKNKIQFAHLTNNCLVKKYANSGIKEKIDKEREQAKKSSPKKGDAIIKEASPSKESPGKSPKDSPAKSSPGKDLSPGKDEDSQESGSEGESDDDTDPENIWSLEDFSNHIQGEF